MREDIYIIEGMSCAACSAAVERVTRKLDGVEESNVNLTTNRMNIRYDETRVTPELIMAKVRKAGFGIKQFEKEENNPDFHMKTKGNGKQDSIYDEEERILKEQKINLISAAVFTLILLYISMGQMIIDNLPVPPIMDMHKYPGNFAMTQLILTIPVLWFGRKFFVVGFKALFHLHPNMDSLVAIGSAAAFIYSIVMTYLIPVDAHNVHNLYYESAAVVITLVMFGKYLEGTSKAKTKGAIKKLMELSPDMAVLADGTEVSTDSLKVGDVVLVRPGAKIPLDGVVTKGSSGVNEAMITGESIPVTKEEGSSVIGGTININGALYVEITKVGQDTTLSKIIKFVEDAQGKKAPISKLADKVAGVFVPAVIAIAVVAAVFWLIAGKDIAFVLRIFTSVLVIACPCSLGLATPTAIMVGTGLGASNGILIRNGEVLEIMHKIDTVVLDKTGTITKGEPSVREVVTDDFDKEELLKIAGIVEKVSDHPLAKAVVIEFEGHFGNNSGEAKYEVKEFHNHSGMGVTANISADRDYNVKVGNKRLLLSNDILLPAFFEREAKRFEETGETPLFVAIDGKVEGIISVADTIKSTSSEAIGLLKKEGVYVVMLTGDNKGAANAIGNQAGVDEIFAEVLPEDKAGVITKLREQGRKVMMVGDGINDAPALTNADVGCAIGNGSDIAIEAGDVVLMKSDLLDVPAAIRLSRLTITNIKENLFWAFLYNSIGLPVAAGVLYPIKGILLNPMIGGLAMSLSSVCVVTNALRLRTKKLRKV